MSEDALAERSGSAEDASSEADSMAFTDEEIAGLEECEESEYSDLLEILPVTQLRNATEAFVRSEKVFG